MRLHAVTLLVDDYDEAIAHYVDDLGFTLVEDTPLTEQKRWVRVSPSADGGTSFVLAVATTDAQRAAVGNQTGRPGGRCSCTRMTSRRSTRASRRGASA